MNVRLVCRLRKSSPSRTPILQVSSEEVSTTPTPPDTLESTPSTVSPFPGSNLGTPETSAAQSQEQIPPISDPHSSKDRYFIMKSLTRDDLMWSVTNNVWATQPHNEMQLNEAFKVNHAMYTTTNYQNSENVYLIFSVNKSGGFFGYAKMASEILDTKKSEHSKSTETGSSIRVSSPPILLAGPKTTVTPRTAKAPRGKIFEDEVRGTVFWEVAESSDSEDESGETSERIPLKGEASNWGNPFRVEWIKSYAL
jgi:hypothetical protein